ncbi:unnamed protein product [Cuscuta europaea]|uniref:CCT domain-containing protein n=1 Tax=Cuscuta europaea TaxID=41803 RepID=A0A9P0YNV0_CUSEU|nr:unnamed protein product [Cuscuta europaea]
MYAENEPIFPYFQSFSQDVQQLEDFCCSQKPIASMVSTISDYDLGGEIDLFNAPETLIQEPLFDLDPMTAAISMISCTDDVMSHELKLLDIESSFDSEPFFNDAFYGCKEVLLEKESTDTPFSEVSDVGIHISANTTTSKPYSNNISANNDEILTGEERLTSKDLFQKSGSSESLCSMEWIQCGGPMKPKFLNFPGLDFNAVYGMRRSFSEGDIKTLGNSLIHSPLGGQQHQIITTSISEARKEKLSRYRSKRNKRNFGRKIKYACRKALADSQPRIRGRFAKTEETTDGSKKQ